MPYLVKHLVRGLVPAGAYRFAAAAWHLRDRWSLLLKTVVARNSPEVWLYFGVAPGDDLLCTAVLRELRHRGHRRVWMVSRHPELFKGSRDVAQVVWVEDRRDDYLSALGGRWQVLEYAPFDPETDRSLPPGRHIIAELCHRAGVRGDVVLRPYLPLSAAELERGRWAGDFIAVQSCGQAARYHMRNKEWFPDRYQEVVRALQGHKFMQFGSATDPPLAGVKDLRGKTTVRETAALLANCRMFVGHVGFLMHLARAVECPSVIIYGGRETPWQSGYTCNLNLCSPLPCAPCWLWNTCDHDRQCMAEISVARVVQAVEQMLARPGHPLAEDKASL
jgi:hypothetical protein